VTPFCGGVRRSCLTLHDSINQASGFRENGFETWGTMMAKRFVQEKDRDKVSVMMGNASRLMRFGPVLKDQAEEHLIISGFRSTNAMMNSLHLGFSYSDRMRFSNYIQRMGGNSFMESLATFAKNSPGIHAVESLNFDPDCSAKAKGFAEGYLHNPISSLNPRQPNNRKKNKTSFSQMSISSTNNNIQCRENSFRNSSEIINFITILNMEIEQFNGCWKLRDKILRYIFYANTDKPIDLQFNALNDLLDFQLQVIYNIPLPIQDEILRCYSIEKKALNSLRGEFDEESKEELKSQNPLQSSLHGSGTNGNPLIPNSVVMSWLAKQEEEFLKMVLLYSISRPISIRKKNLEVILKAVRLPPVIGPHAEDFNAIDIFIEHVNKELNSLH
jgi:hypothetical protein